jgi:hypothetical protein
MPHEDDIPKRIELFKSDLLALEAMAVVRKRIIFGSCFLLSPDISYELKAEVAKHFRIHPSEVLIVGSAMLGFTLAAEDRYRSFGDKSDIDVAILAPGLFDDIWRLLYDYERDGGDWTDARKFKEYLFRGWIRPDKLPVTDRFNIRSEWFEFFRELSASGRFGPYKVAAGLYKSWHFLENYQVVRVADCQSHLKENS